MGEIIKRTKKYLSLILVLSMLFSMFSGICGHADYRKDQIEKSEEALSQSLGLNQIDDEESVTEAVYTGQSTDRLAIMGGDGDQTLPVNSPQEQLDKNLAYILKNTQDPTFGTGGGEWSVLSLARANYSVPEGYYNIYYNNVVNEVKKLMMADEDNNKPEGRLDKSKGTEHSRLILGLTSIGRDITNVAGYDISKALADYNYVIRQGINGPIFALIAFDAHNYDIPKAEETEEQTTREKLIDYILAREIKGGGWALGDKPSAPDPDITAMAIQGLTPYYEKETAVKTAVDRALDWLSKAQKEDGGFASWGSVNSESIAQVVVALTGLGINPHTDERFIKNGHSAIDALMTFAVPEGGFYHIKPGGTGNGGAEPGVIDGMATDQGTYALVAYDRFVNKKSSLYDMADVGIQKPDTKKPIITVEGLANNQKVTEKELSFKVTAKDNAGKNIIPVVKLRGEVITGTDGRYTVTLIEGQNIITIEAADVAGNKSDISYKLIYEPKTEPGGPVNPTPTKKYITLSIDKETINKGYVISPAKVELQSGDTVWTLTKREMDKRGIKYKYDYYEKYKSVYVRSIAGDGEFDNGEGSGWMYNVNGWYPNYGASVYKLEDGDVLQWRYTTDYGVDLGEDITKWDMPTITVEGISDNKTFSQSEITFKVTAKSTYGPIKGQDADVTVKLNGKTVEMIGGSYTVILKDGDNILEITAVDSEGNKRDKKYKLIYKSSGAGGGIGGGGGGSTGGGGGSIGGGGGGGGSIGGGTGAGTGGEIRAATVDNNKPEDMQNDQNKIIDLQKLYADSSSISSWALEYIKRASEKGFISGSDGKLNPKANITRAEFIKIIVSVLGIDVNQNKVINFKDVNENDWFYPYINAAYKAGITEGSGNEFNPKDNITREQMAAIIVRALNEADKAAESTAVFNDMDKVSPWAKSYVETASALGLIAGNNGSFDPKSFATKEMAIVTAMRSYDYRNSNKAEDSIAPRPEKTEDIEKPISKDVKKSIEETAEFMQKIIANPVVASVGGEWTVFGLARSGVKVPDEYYAGYYSNVEKTLKEKSGKLHDIKYTEYDRVILALTSIGKDVKNVAGYDLTKPLADFNTLIKQGINGPIFALIALDSNNYEIPIDKDVKVQTTRQMLIDFILGREIDGGGWALGVKPSAADPDITAMAIQGLAPYYKKDENVKAAVDRAIIWLSGAQKKDGGYLSWGSINSESIAQVIVALTSLGIDPHNDPRFIKNGYSAVDALLSFAVPEGGFYHVKPGGTGNGGAEPGVVDPMATDQAMYALVAYNRFINGQNGLYDMTDVKK